MRFPPSDEDTCHSADIIDLSILDNIKEILLLNHVNLIEPILDYLPAIHKDCNNPAIFTANTNDEEKPTPELKELPSHLEYAFLDNNRELPVITLHYYLTRKKITIRENSKPTVQPQRRLNLKVQDVIKTKIVKLLDSGFIYAISDSPWVSPIHVVPKKGGITVIANKDNELIPTRTVTGWRVCIDYRKLNDATRKDHFPLPFIDQICEETNLVLNWEKCHFMVKEGIVLGHKISKAGIEVDKAKVDVIASLPYPTNVKGIRSFLGHAGLNRRFIKDFSKIARPMTQLLMKDAKFDFSDECIKSFDILRDKLITALVIIAPNWDLDFELMCDVSDSTVGAVLG
ncbi:reverse transcriptase domain-containing protein [Tanacetum coccineum]